MSEPGSDYVNYTHQRGEHLEMVVEIYDSADAVKDHELPKKDAQDVKTSLQTGHTGG